MDVGDEARDVEALETVLFRFVSTEDAQFEDAVNRVLPKVLAYLSKPSERTRNKVLEILAHVNKRLQVQPSIQIPVRDILALFTSPAGNNSFVASFCLVYLEMGFLRMPAEARVELIPATLVGIAARVASQQTTLLHIFLEALPHFRLISLTDEERAKRFPVSLSAADRAVILQFFLDVLLYTPQASGAAPPGLSAEAVDRVTKTGKVIWKLDDWNRKIDSVLDFLIAGVFPGPEIVPHLLLASSLGSQASVMRAEAAFKRLRQEDYDHAGTVKTMMQLYLGDIEKKDANPPLSDRQRRSAVPFQAKLKILQMLSRCSAAASQGMLTVQVGE